MSQSQSNLATTLLLIDGSSYLYRAFYAMPNLRLDSKDINSQPTGAIRGMVNMLQALKKEYPVDYVACVFDAKGTTFRDDIYPEYKANRTSMPEELKRQIEPIHQAVRLLGFPVLTVPQVEADDVIGTLAKIASQQGIDVIISSGDKDLCQLVNRRVKLVDTMNNKVRDEAGVLQEFGIAPNLMIDYQAIVGDSVDNIPGVPKVGPKTAVKWLTEYGSLDNIIANANNIGGVVGNNLRASLNWLVISKALVTIKTDCELTKYLPNLPKLVDLKMLEVNVEQLREFYVKYGFQSLLNKLEPTNKPIISIKTSTDKTQIELFTAASVTDDSANEQGDLFSISNQLIAKQSFASKFDYQTILTWQQFEYWLDKINSAQLTAIDTETSSLQPMQAKLVGISFSVEPGKAAYLPLMHDYTGVEQQLPIQQVLVKLKPWLEDSTKAKLGQNSKYEQHVFANHGINIAGYVHDTMLQSYVLEADMPHGLANLALRHLSRSAINYEDLCGKGTQQIPFSKVDIALATKYAAEDAEQCLAVHLKLWPQIQQSEQLQYIYQLELNCSLVLFKMEREGVLIDQQELQRQSIELQKKIDQCTQQAYSLAGQEFNLNSPKQIGEIFYHKLGYPVIKKTATGAASTNEEVLEKLALDYPLPATILQHRSFYKLKSTYTDKLPLLINPQSKRVHTSYAQSVAVTGRLSSVEPNLQNIPVRTAEGRAIRKAFIAPQGKLIASADYSQIELRIMAHLSADDTLLKAFAQGKDIHKATAAEIFAVALEQVTAEQRRLAKVINFGLIYGMGAIGLARNLGISNTQAKNYIETYFSRYPGVKHYMDQTRVLAKEQGYVETVFGRRLMLPQINSPKAMLRAAAERAAINAPMQGTAADLIKLSMVKVQQVLEQERSQVKLIMQVHDELVFELEPDDKAWVKQRIPEIMASVAQLTVPLIAEIGFGANWEQAH